MKVFVVPAPTFSLTRKFDFQPTIPNFHPSPAICWRSDCSYISFSHYIVFDVLTMTILSRCQGDHFAPAYPVLLLHGVLNFNLWLLWIWKRYHLILIIVIFKQNKIYWLHWVKKVTDFFYCLFEKISCVIFNVLNIFWRIFIINIIDKVSNA